MWSACCILCDELRCQDFEVSHGIRKESSEPTEQCLLEGGWKDLTPYCLVGCVQGHLCFEDIHLLV